jgi:hypothetical protein
VSESCVFEQLASKQLSPVFKFVRYYEPATRHLYDTTQRYTINTVCVVLNECLAAVAFLIDFASFFVGIICFADFDKGLRASKSSGQCPCCWTQKPFTDDLHLIIEAPGSKFVGSYAGPVNPEGDKRLIID